MFAKAQRQRSLDGAHSLSAERAAPRGHIHSRPEFFQHPEERRVSRSATLLPPQSFKRCHREPAGCSI